MLISSSQNPTIKLTKQLLANHRQRKKNSLTILEGVHLIDASLNANYPIQQVLVAENSWDIVEVCELIARLQEKEISILTIEDKLYQDISTINNGIDIMAIIPIKNMILDEINEDCLILNDVQDSGNVGTLMRTAAAVGITNIVCTSNTAQAWSPKTLRSGMGAQFSLNIYENVSIDNLLDAIKVPILATSSHTDKIIYQTNLKTAIAWVMGHEGQGVCQEILDRSKLITIPQPNGQESLNVGVAGALCMYEALRQRKY